MPKRKVKKRLIEPKVRLLLRIYLYGVENESNWLAKLAKEIDYSAGSLYNQIMDLLNKNMIKSLNPDGVSPPYRITEEGKNFLKPILFTSKIGMIVSLWVSLWTVIYYIIYFDKPIEMVAKWLPLLLVSFVTLALVLIFYPRLLLKLGKISY